MPLSEQLESLKAVGQAAEAAALRVSKQTSALVVQAEVGDLAGIRKSLTSLGLSGTELMGKLNELQPAWSWSIDEETTYLRDRYPEEVVSAARLLGLTWNPDQARIEAPPVVVRVDVSRRVLLVGKKTCRNLHPRAAVEFVRKSQATGPSVPLAQLLEAIRRVCAPAELGTWVPLSSVFAALTALPRSAAEYAIDEFAFDLGALYEANLRTAKDGTILEFLAASSAGRAGRGMVARLASGEAASLYAVRFIRDAATS